MNSQFKLRIIWIPLGVLMLIASTRILYWERMETGHTNAGGGFGPFCSPLYKNILTVTMTVDNKRYLYKGSLGSPIKYLMLPQKNLIDEIGRRILTPENFELSNYLKPYGNLSGEISIANGTLNTRPISRKEIQYMHLDLWVLQDKDEHAISNQTKYYLKESFRYN